MTAVFGRLDVFSICSVPLRPQKHTCYLGQAGYGPCSSAQQGFGSWLINDHKVKLCFIIDAMIVDMYHNHFRPALFLVFD